MKPQSFNTPNFSELRQKLKMTNIEDIEYKITEYEKFFFLIKKYPKLKAVPTKSIDIVWHYHLGDTNLYNKDCIAYVGHAIQHKESTSNAELLDLENNFRTTNELWLLNFDQSLGSRDEMAICGVGDDDGGDNGGGHGGNDD